MKRILVFSREHITNYGDPILADCCKFLIERAAIQNNIKAEVTIVDIYETNINILTENLSKSDAIVFPGGGVNAPKFNEIILNIMERATVEGIEIYFNSIGLDSYNPNNQNTELLEKMFNHPNVKQVTTRGSYDTLKKLINSRQQLPSKWVLDPAIWTNETYGIEKKKSKIIGIGLIRAEIFKDNGLDFERSQVINMYENIIHELEFRGYQWRFFTNGMKSDYTFGVKLLKKMKRNPEVFLGDIIKNKAELVTNIAGFHAIIAARMHANIIAASLGIPTIGLTWNEKMNYFGESINKMHRFMSIDNLLNSKLIVDKLEHAIIEGYDLGHINRMKAETFETIVNIVKHKM
jgi:Uncharacterized conserved protein